MRLELCLHRQSWAGPRLTHRLEEGWAHDMAGRSISACLNSAQLWGKGDNDSRVVPALPTATLVALLVRAQGTGGQVYRQLLRVVYSCVRSIWIY